MAILRRDQTKRDPAPPRCAKTYRRGPRCNRAGYCRGDCSARGDLDSQIGRDSCEYIRGRLPRRTGQYGRRHFGSSNFDFLSITHSPLMACVCVFDGQCGLPTTVGKVDRYLWEESWARGLEYFVRVGELDVWARELGNDDDCREGGSWNGRRWTDGYIYIRG